MIEPAPVCPALAAQASILDNASYQRSHHANDGFNPEWADYRILLVFHLAHLAVAAPVG